MRFYIKTYGCQANEADSERIARIYEAKGYKRVRNTQEAGVVIINTCSVRQSAENRVGGLMNNLSKQKKRPKIVLAGCMLRYGISDLKKKYPQIDEFLRTESVGFDIEPVRSSKEALVPIMEGCNQFCTYCVVPYARGREKSRLMEEIICEVERLVKEGVKEITLLGQNVNAYGKSPASLKSPFASLLEKLSEIPNLEKIKFLTSNPWDLTDEIIQSIKLTKVDKYLHLPVQSGDDGILKRMNRPYTAKQYFDLIKKIRKNIPEIEIGTDIIVGFPGETEEAFQNTVNLCKEAEFAKAYIARYSPRPGTVAYKFPDDVSPQEKKRRWKVLDELINKIKHTPGV